MEMKKLSLLTIQKVSVVALKLTLDNSNLNTFQQGLEHNQVIE